MNSSRLAGLVNSVTDSKSDQNSISRWIREIWYGTVNKVKSRTGGWHPRGPYRGTMLGTGSASVDGVPRVNWLLVILTTNVVPWTPSILLVIPTRATPVPLRCGDTTHFSKFCHN